MLESKSTAEIDRYTPDTILIRQKHPGRFAFRAVVDDGKSVLLHYVSKTGKRYGSLIVSARTFEREFSTAFTETQRQQLRVALLTAISREEEAPKGCSDAQLYAAMRWLKSNDYIIEHPDDGFKCTEKGQQAVERITQNAS